MFFYDDPDPEVVLSTEDIDRPPVCRALVAVLVIIGLFCWLTRGSGGQEIASAAEEALKHSRPSPSATVKPKNKLPPLARKGAPLRPPPSTACVREYCGKQLGYAAIIVDQGRRFTRLPERAWVIAVATAMQESSLQNEANRAHPETLNLPYDKIGADTDSVGLFQQRPSQGWGDPVELMQPQVAAAKFYAKLQKVVAKWQGWQTARLTDVAQAVQRSGVPGAYQKREAAAISVVDYVQRFTIVGQSQNSNGANNWFVMVGCARRTSANCRSVPWRLVLPIVDNRNAYHRFFPDAGNYLGDLGDAAHQNAEPEDHTPIAESCVSNRCNGQGWVYAQDFGGGPGFDLNEFVRWLLDQVRAGKYARQIKYIISTIPANYGSRYYGIFDCRYGWRAQERPADHVKHVHISYQPGAENSHSTIIADFAASLRR